MFRHDAGTTASSGCRHLGDANPAAAVGRPAAGSAPEETESDLADLARLQTFLALLGLELHTLTFCEVAEALHLDLGLVNEEVIPAAVRRNETKALFGVEPLNCTYTHNCHSLKFTHGNAGIHL